jgi:mRNA interferase MazF
MTRGDIVLVDLPQTKGGAGHEQVGTRPALIVHEEATSNTLSVIMVIPFTSQLNAQSFPHTILIQPSAENGLNYPSVLLIFQLRAIDRNRITDTIGHLDENIMEHVNDQLRLLLGLEKKTT